MSRIRTIKPEFWTSEQVMECSPMARLLFIGLWNFCDDNGVHPASCKTLKAEVFPGDDITSSGVADLVTELIGQGLLAEFSREDKKYWFVTGWHHQRIDRPSPAKYPLPPASRRTLDERSTSPRGTLATEGKGREGKGKDIMAAVVKSVDTPARAGATPSGHPAAAADLKKLISALPVPWPEILSAYHRILPGCVPCHVPTEKLLRQVARLCDPVEDQLPALENWEMYFGHVAKSPLLTGRAPPGHGFDRPFVADLDWLTDWNNFQRVAYENRYHQTRRNAPEVRHGLPH